MLFRNLDLIVVILKRDVFDYIQMFHDPKPKHARNGMLSPVEFEITPSNPA